MQKYFIFKYRITGLDCARLGFYPALYEVPLNVMDANFVDTIHSDNFFVGAIEPIGHVSFYVNNGMLQPGCPQYRIWNNISDPLNSEQTTMHFDSKF